MYRKKIAEQNCSSKKFLDLIKFTSDVSSQNTHTARPTSFNFNYYIIQVSHIKCHVFLLLSAITNNSEVVNYTSTLSTFILPLRNMDTSSSYTVDIIENQILKAINHIKYISKKKPCTLKTLITYEIITLQIMITILLKIN